MKNKTKVWDFPTRLFHWLLAASLPFMWYSAKAGGDMLQWHTRVGLLVLFLLVFRLCWGIWGSDTARFSRFVRGWAGIRGYLKNGIPEHIQPGHNPLGALMVVALLAAVSFQVGTGLLPPMKTPSAPTATSTIWFPNIRAALYGKSTSTFSSCSPFFPQSTSPPSPHTAYSKRKTSSAR